MDKTDNTDQKRSQKYWQQDLLNTLIFTLDELLKEGVDVDVIDDREGWTGIYLRTYLCPKCRRLTANSLSCAMCEPTTPPTSKMGSKEGNSD